MQEILCAMISRSEVLCSVYEVKRSLHSLPFSRCQLTVAERWGRAGTDGQSDQSDRHVFV